MAERTLLAIGLRPGEPIRFRRHTGGRWLVGKVARIEPDGSVTLHDPDGAARSLRPETLQVRRPGTRGHLVWTDVSDVAVTWEQLELFPVESRPDAGDRRGRGRGARRVSGRRSS